MAICLTGELSNGASHHCHVVDSSTLERCLDQCSGGVRGIVGVGEHSPENVLVGQHVGEAVRAEQQQVTAPQVMRK